MHASKQTHAILRRLSGFSCDDTTKRGELTVMEGQAMIAVAKVVRGPRVTSVYCRGKGENEC